jgi:AcrR family transcriptional regulator
VAVDTAPIPAARAVVSRRERKKHATRDALEAAALDLVEARGLASVTVEGIAERADVAMRTFFNHFSSKEDAVIGWDPDGVGEVLAALAAEPRSDDPVARLHRVLIPCRCDVRAALGVDDPGRQS